MLKYKVGDVVKIRKLKEVSKKSRFSTQSLMDSCLPKNRVIKITYLSNGRNYYESDQFPYDEGRGYWGFDDSFIARCVKRAKKK